MALLYAGIDQGNRLDWLNSGTIIGLLLAGGLLLVAFVVNELVVERPLIDLKALLDRNVCIPPFMIATFVFGSTATSFILPDYLERVQGLRSLQIGDVLNWVALPQIVLVPFLAWALRYLDARLLLAVGLATQAVGSWMDTGLTHDWAGDDFLPSQLVEAVGLALSITSVVIFSVSNITPARAVTIAGLIQTGRLLGSEIGSAFIQSFVRIQEQVTSNLTGLHLQTGADLAEQRTTQLSLLFGDRASSVGHSTGAAILTLDSLVRREAYVLAYIDAFWIVAWVLTASLVLLVFLKPPPPNHLTPPRLRRTKASGSRPSGKPPPGSARRARRRAGRRRAARRRHGRDPSSAAASRRRPGRAWPRPARSAPT